MKRIISITLATLMIILTLAPLGTQAADISLRVKVDGTLLAFPDAQPFIDNNSRTQTPARFIGEALGAQVSWDAREREATFVKGAQTLVIAIDSSTYRLNGTQLTMDTEAIIVDGRTFVPARYIAQAFGAEVSWEGSTKTVIIESEQGVKPLGTGDVKVYDGVEIDMGKDLTKYGEFTEEKSTDLYLNFAKHINLVTRDGVHYVEGRYPELPEGYRWILHIDVFWLDRDVRSRYTSSTIHEEKKLPGVGSFSVKAVEQDLSKMDMIQVYLEVRTKENYSTGRMIIESDSVNPDRERVAKFITEYNGERFYYTDEVDFDTIFGWEK